MRRNFVSAHSRGRECALAGPRVRGRGAESAQSFLDMPTGCCDGVPSRERVRIYGWATATTHASESVLSRERVRIYNKGDTCVLLR